MNDIPTISDQIRLAVRHCGLTVTQVAERVGVPRQNLHAFLSGKRGVSLEVLDRIGLLLGVHLRTSGRFEVRVVFQPNVTEPGLMPNVEVANVQVPKVEDFELVPDPLIIVPPMPEPKLRKARAKRSE